MTLTLWLNSVCDKTMEGMSQGTSYGKDLAANDREAMESARAI